MVVDWLQFQTYGTLYLHMVWGWGTSKVAYFAFDNWSSVNGPFNDDKKMMTNIRQ